MYTSRCTARSGLPASNRKKTRMLLNKDSDAADRTKTCILYSLPPTGITLCACACVHVCVFVSSRARFKQPHYTVMQPHYTIIEPHYTVIQPHYTVKQPHYTVIQPHYTIIQPHYIPPIIQLHSPIIHYTELCSPIHPLHATCTPKAGGCSSMC
jgi:hypothetical protein